METRLQASVPKRLLCVCVCVFCADVVLIRQAPACFQKAPLPPAGHSCLLSRLEDSTCMAAAAGPFLARGQSSRVGQAVNGDHASGAGHRQETQSGHEGSLWGLSTFS